MKALSGQSRAVESDGNKGFVGSKPYGRVGREQRLCRVKAVRTSRTGTKAFSGQSRADEQTRAKALSGQSRADERTGQKAEAKMGVILVLRR